MSRNILDGAHLHSAIRRKIHPYKYLEYGSYLGDWRRRLALKMWTGWPTFPMVFVKGVLVGGAEDVKRLIESGELKQMLSGKSTQSRLTSSTSES